MNFATRDEAAHYTTVYLVPDSFFRECFDADCPEPTPVSVPVRTPRKLHIDNTRVFPSRPLCGVDRDPEIVAVCSPAWFRIWWNRALADGDVEEIAFFCEDCAQANETHELASEAAQGGGTIW